MELGKKVKQKHFVLIHGGCHGAWCWYKVVTRLRSEGHLVTALDMVAAGRDPRSVDEITSFSDYCQPLMEFMADLPSGERVVLVGHSYGGICISLAMEKFPEKIGLAVFVSGFMPGPGLTASAVFEQHERQVDSYMDSQYSYSNGPHNPPTSILVGPKFLAACFYQLSPPEDLTLATLMVRPARPVEEFWDAGLTDDNYGSVGRVFVMAGEDNILKRPYQEWMTEKNPPAEVSIISGADHMVMFSRTQQLCALLQDLADRYLE